MSKIEDKAVDIMDKAMVGAEKLTEKLAELAQQYGPDVVNAGIEVARLTAAGSLLQAIGWALAGAALSAISVRLYRRAVKRDEEMRAAKEFAAPAFSLTDYWSLERKIPSGLFAGAAAFAFVCTGTRLFNIWNWVGVVEPKLWIAHRILEKAL